MCRSRYSVVDSLAPMVSRPAELSRSSAMRVVHLLVQALEAPGVLQHGAAGVGQNQILARPVDQFLAQFLLQPLQRQRDRRLRAQQFLRGAREALLRGDGQKDLKGMEFHECLAQV